MLAKYCSTPGKHKTFSNFAGRSRIFISFKVVHYFYGPPFPAERVTRAEGRKCTSLYTALKFSLALHTLIFPEIGARSNSEACPDWVFSTASSGTETVSFNLARQLQLCLELWMLCNRSTPTMPHISASYFTAKNSHPLCSCCTVP